MGAQSGVIIAWPHPDSDWAGNYAAIERCYLDIATAIHAVKHCWWHVAMRIYDDRSTKNVPTAHPAEACD